MVFLLCDKVCKIDYSFLGFIGLKNKKKCFLNVLKLYLNIQKLSWLPGPFKNPNIQCHERLTPTPSRGNYDQRRLLLTLGTNFVQRQLLLTYYFMTLHSEVWSINYCKSCPEMLRSDSSFFVMVSIFDNLGIAYLCVSYFEIFTTLLTTILRTSTSNGDKNQR